MSDEEDPYAVSSDSEDEGHKKPPPKIAIEGRSTTDLKQIKEALAGDEKKSVKNETMEEVEELRRAKAEELGRVKRDFEEGRAGGDGTAAGQKESLEGVGKENLASMKEMFEKEPAKEFVPQRDDLFNELQQQAGDRKKLKTAFERTPEDEEQQKNCCICDKIVYPVEKIWAGKRLYHTQCFKCATCGKKLNQNAFNSHQGILYCKPHMMEALHPERVGQFAAEELEEGGQPMQVDDEFAVSSRPKQLAADVVRAGGSSIGDELAQLKSSLKDKKESLQTSMAAGAQSGTTVDDEEKRRQLDEIKSQVSEVKQKWRTGGVEGASGGQEDAAKQEELDALKKGGNLKERFQPPSDSVEVQKCYDRSELDTAAIADARKSFVEGSAYASSKAESAAAGELNELKFRDAKAFKDKFEKGQGDFEEIEKAKVELDLQLNELKKAFEKPESEMSPEERAAKKKAEIEAEFARYKLARKLQAKKAKEQAADGGDDAEGQQQEEDGAEKELDVQIKMAGKAREKFKQIEAQGRAGIPQPGHGQQQKTPSKWDKKADGSAGAEVVNRRAAGNDDTAEEEAAEEEFDVKNLMAKFKNIATTTGPRERERNLDELEALRVEAKNLREQFEKSNQMDASEMTEEKRRQLDEEFKQLKEERELARKQLEEEQAEAAAAAAAGGDKEDVQVAAAHASKMAAKWEKIHKKEAKKAEKSKMPQK